MFAISFHTPEKPAHCHVTLVKPRFNPADFYLTISHLPTYPATYLPTYLLMSKLYTQICSICMHISPAQSTLYKSMRVHVHKRTRQPYGQTHIRKYIYIYIYTYIYVCNCMYMYIHILYSIHVCVSVWGTLRPKCCQGPGPCGEAALPAKEPHALGLTQGLRKGFCKP